MQNRARYGRGLYGSRKVVEFQSEKRAPFGLAFHLQSSAIAGDGKVNSSASRSVCELVDALRIPQYNISRHLHILVKAGLLEDRRRGKWVYYRIAPQAKSYQRTLLETVSELRGERQDFHEDEARARRRLKLRRDGVCCVGLVSRAGAALERRKV